MLSYATFKYLAFEDLWLEQRQTGSVHQTEFAPGAFDPLWN